MSRFRRQPKSIDIRIVVYGVDLPVRHRQAAEVNPGFHRVLAVEKLLAGLGYRAPSAPPDGY